jgi:hypothetical protein
MELLKRLFSIMSTVDFLEVIDGVTGANLGVDSDIVLM